MTIEERLEELEREVIAAKRRNRWVLGGAALLILGCLTIAATLGDKQTIRARQFIVVDDQGRERAALDMYRDGPMLTLSDENGKMRAEMGVYKDGPILTMMDENSKPRVKMNVNNYGPMLTMKDQNGKSRAEMNVTKGGPGLGMADENGKSLWTAP